MLTQKRPWEKASIESALKGTVMKMLQYTTSPPYYFTSDAWLQLRRWEKAHQSRLREKGKVRTHSKRHWKLNCSSWDLAGKLSFVILLRATMAREPQNGFYLSKKGQCFIQVLLGLEWHRQRSIPGGELWDAVVKRNHGPLTDQFIRIWKTHSPNTEHHHPEGSCGQ